MGKALLDSSVFSVMNEHELMSDERIVFIYFIVANNRTMHGLYEIHLLDVSYQTGVSKDRIPPIISTLQNEKLIQYSNRLIFVPQIPEQENFKRRIYSDKLDLNAKNFKNALNKYSFWKGEGTEVNKAYQAFCNYYKDEIPYVLRERDNATPTVKLFTNSSNAYETATEPPNSPLKTVSGASYNTTDTVGGQFANPLGTVGQNFPDGLETIGRPPNEKTLTVGGQFANPLGTVGQNFPDGLETIGRPPNEKKPTVEEPPTNHLPTT